MRNGNFGRAFLGLSVAAAALCAVPAAAQQATQRYDLSEQSLGSALRTISIQSGQSIVAPAELVAGKRSRALAGTYSTDDAVARLLDGSGLRAVRVGNALVIQRQSAESAQDAQGDREGSGTEVILVTGTRIRGRAPAGAAVTVVDRKAIDQSGYSTTQQVIQSLPQNFMGGPNETTQETNRGGAGLNVYMGSSINLRGLGPSSTLVLVNGDRIAAGYAGIFTDLSMVPLTAVERIEVLPDGASALYGSDAVAGVVNIVPRNRFTGLETVARYGVADGLDEVLLSGIAGRRWASGHVTVSYEYYGRSRLMARDRPFVSEDLRRYGAGDFRSPFANPGTIIAGGRSYAIPAGQNGRTLTPAALTLGTNVEDGWASANVLPQQRRHGAFLDFSQELGGIELYAQSLFGERRFDSRGRVNSNGLTLTVPVTNAFYVDPVGTRQPVRVRYSFVDDLGPESIRGRSRAFNLSGGLRGDLGTWRLDAHGTFAVQSDAFARYNVVNTARLAQALADPSPATAFNPFGEGSNTDPATITRVRGSLSSGGRYRLWGVQARAEGPLFALPGGSARLAFGVEHRDERYRDRPVTNDTSALTPTTITTYMLDAHREVSAGYAELALPLVAPDNGVPLLNRVDLSAAVRTERYSDFGWTTNPKFGASWSPVEGVTLRGTWGTSFRAPNFNDAAQDITAIVYFAVALQDSTSPSGTTTALIVRGNDPDLRPERATSWTLGAELAPSLVPGLSARLTYFDVDYRDRIANPASELFSFLTNRPVYAAIIDDSPDPAVVASYYASPFYRDFYGIPASQVTTIIDARTQNLAVQRLTGLDFDLGYAADIAGGRGEIGVSGSYLIGFSQGLTPTAARSELVGTLGNPPDLRLRGRLTYGSGGFGGAVFVNFVNGYVNRAVTPNLAVSSWTTVDARLSYRFEGGSGPLRGLSIALNVSNLFDRDPPFTVNRLGTTTLGYDPENASPLGRLVSLQVTKSW